MPRTPCSSQPLVDLIREQKVVMYADLQNALGPVSRQTVYRKMVEIGVRSSYSHGGRYYTLDECADYDANGLWSYGEIHFSRHNTLNDTLVYLVDQSPRGLFARDLKQIVKLEVLTVLHRLTKTDRMFRSKIGDHYVYFSTNADRRRRQRHRFAAPPILWTSPFVEAVQRFCGTLDEKQRRLFAGLEALRADSGGDRKVADLLGMSRTTVTKGRKQILSGDFEKNRIRKSGGGRKSIEKNPRIQRTLCTHSGEGDGGRSNPWNPLGSNDRRQHCRRTRTLGNSGFGHYGASSFVRLGV